MKPRFYFDNWFAKKIGVGAVVLYPLVLFSMEKERASRSLIQHEWIHVRQVRQTGWLKFYFLYLAEYFKHLVRLKDPGKAYLAISYEQEAYANQSTVALTEAEQAEINQALQA